MTMVETMMDSKLADLLENIALQSSETLAARQAAGVSLAVNTYSDTTSFESLLETFRGLAFEVDAEDPWRILGIPKYEGPIPTKDMVDARVRDGKLVATLAKKSWEEHDYQRAAAIPNILEKAKEDVLRELPKVAREVKKLSNDGRSTPRHLEASPELVLECLSMGGHVATQLSNLQGMDLTAMKMSGNDKVVSIGDARALYCEVTKGAKQAAAALKHYRDGGITMWAPSDGRRLQYLLAAMMEIAVSRDFEVTLRMLVPHAPFPSCSTPELVLDLWSHASLGVKWKPLLRQVDFLRQPTRCVFSGAYGPLHHVKAVAIMTFATSGPSGGKRIRDWMPTILAFEEQPAIIIDFPTEAELQVKQSLVETKLPGLDRIDGPRRSLGHTTLQPRSALTLSFDSGLVSEVEVRMFINVLREDPLMAGCILGSRKLFGDSGAILMDINNPSVASQFFNMMDEAIYVSQNLVALHTTSSAEEWSNTMTLSVTSSPLASIQKMRYRASNKGGRPFAKPQLLDKDIDSLKTNASTAKASQAGQERRKLLVTISIQSLAAAGRESIANKIVEALADGIHTYAVRTSPGDLNEGEWRLMLTADGQWTGRLQFQARSTEAIQLAHRKLHGTAIEIDGSSHMIEIKSDFVRNPKEGH